MLSLADTNLTQITGVIAFGAAACTSVLAARRARGGAVRVWKLLAVLHCVFVAEILLGLRHDVHGGINAFLQEGGWYAQRQTLQLGLLGAALIAGAAALVTMWYWSRSHRAARPAVLATGGVVVLFAMETISLHAIDALLYQRIGPVMLIALLWAACAAVVVGACLRRR